MTTKTIEFIKDRSVDLATLIAAIGTIQSGFAERVVSRITGWHMSNEVDAKLLQVVVIFAVIWSFTRGLRKKFNNAKDALERTSRSRVLQEVKRACHSRLEKALPGGKRIRLRCRWVSNDVNNPLDERLEDSILTAGSPDDGADDRVAVHFRESCSSLLVLGKPGSGKSVMLLRLCLDLVEKAERDVEQLVPVFLNFSGWSDGDSFHEWLTSQISINYAIDRFEASYWLEDKKLIILLDGLDEISDRKVRSRCVEKLNRYVTNNRGISIAICCRSGDYRGDGQLLALDKLHLVDAIEICDIDPVETTKYLRGCPSLQGWKPELLLQEIHDNKVALSQIKSPFWVWTAVTLLSNGGKLPKGDFSQDSLVAAFVAQRFQSLRPDPARTEQKFRRWMLFAAKSFGANKQTMFGMRELKPLLMGRRSIKITSSIILVIFCGLFSVGVCFVVWFAYAPIDIWLTCRACKNGTNETLFHFLVRYWSSPVCRQDLLGCMNKLARGGANFGALVGMIAGMIGIVVDLSPLTLGRGINERFEFRIRKSMRMAVRFLLWSAIPLLVLGGICTAAHFNDISMEKGYGFGFSLPAALWIMFGVSSLIFFVGLITGEVPYSGRSFGKDAGQTLAVAAVTAVVAAVLAWQIPVNKIAYYADLPLGMVDRFDLPLLCALIVFFVAGGLFLIRHYVVRFVVVLFQAAPWRYHQFLEKAHEYYFLRRTAYAYSFRNSQMWSHFANEREE